MNLKFDPAYRVFSKAGKTKIVSFVYKWMGFGEISSEVSFNPPQSEALPAAQQTDLYFDIDDYQRHNGKIYSAPIDLRRSDTSLGRVRLFGSCLLELWPGKLARDGVTTAIDMLILSANPPSAPPFPVNAYAFQVCQIPLRSVLSDSDYANWLRTPAGDQGSLDNLLNNCYRNIDFWLTHLLVWADSIPTFVINYFTPQYNLHGRCFAGCDTTSNIYILQQINRYLETKLASRKNVYLLDLDRLAGVHGRRYVQDDSIWTLCHGSLIEDNDLSLDTDRLVKVPALSKHYRTEPNEFVHTLWCEVEAMYRSLRQIDAVKMLCVDLDDTLWRGVLAELDEDDIDVNHATEGWPLGIVEALLTLRRRGIILALISKNDMTRISGVWDRVFGTRLRLDDFAIVKMSWRDKSISIGEAIREANLLPSSVVFLDDNPVERAGVRRAFPDIRVIDTSHYYWKRILLWSPETQTGGITMESSRRSDMVRSQIQREADRLTLSREEFLVGLNLHLKFNRIDGHGHSFFSRCLELLNKTNQFNTTGRRWTLSELDEVCHSGLVIGCEARDKHSDYGIILVAILVGSAIEQIVMSCRVVGLDVEIAAVAWLSTTLLVRHDTIFALTRKTEANLLSRDLFERCGWLLVDEKWQAQQACQSPPHLAIALPAMAA